MLKRGLLFPTREQGNLGGAASNYRRLVEIRPSADAHRKLAQVLTQLGQTDEARTEMTKANAMDRAAR